MNFLSNFHKKAFATILKNCMGSYEQRATERKRALFSHARGTIVEIGCGTGPNLRYYPKESTVIGIEPNIHMHPHFIESAHKAGIPDVRVIQSPAEKIALPDNSADTVISTLVFCSVHNPAAVLQEIRRILKPGGVFLFIEHVAAPCGTVHRAVQNAINPIWKIVCDGCNMNRETEAVIRAAGFSSVDCENFSVRKYGFTAPHLIGMAVK